MRTAVLACVLATSFAFAAEPLDLPSAGAYALGASAGPGLLHQCSREVPTEVGEYWEPSAPQIAELESLLVTFMGRQVAANRPSNAGPQNRQYVGYVKDGERFIYGNFYPARVGKGIRESEEPVVACYGGAAFWGIVYGVRSRSFSMLRFNGRA